MSRSDYDGIILGAGHNALILQAYLCRSGLKVLAVDRAALCGGGLMSIENPRIPGVLHNIHSFYHRAITAMPWYRDLGLEQLGARYIEPERNVVMRLADGRSLEWWTDLDRTAASFEQFSKRDALALRRWAEDFRPIVDEILVPEAQSPPKEPEERRRFLNSSANGRRLLEVQALSPLEFVCREFENDAIRAGLLFFNGLREVDLRLRGFGHAIPALLASPHKAQMCAGGSERLADALVRDIRNHSGEVLLNAEIKRIIVRSGQAEGLELASGEVIRASGFIASGLNPQQTFLQYLNQSEVSPDVREKAVGFEYNLIAPLMAVHLTLREPPNYSLIEPDGGQLPFMVILGLEKLEQFHEMVAAHEQGNIPPAIMWGTCPTLFDSTQAPAGLHTAFMWQKTPYALHGNPNSWEAAKAELGKRMLDVWSAAAPNLVDAIVDEFILTPVDTESILPNMTRGDLLVGSFARGQIGYNRPFAGAGQYRTPIKKLYLCGGSTHPGGNITGLCGYNAARVIAAELGLKIWWNPPQI